MRLPFGRVVEFAHTRPHEVTRALNDFFKREYPGPEEEELIFPIFTEWLIFDYKPTSGTTFLIEYCLRNPDRLNKTTITRMKRAAASHNYSQFEIQDIKRGKYIDVEDLCTGQKFRVWEEKGSSGKHDKGSVHARIALIDGKYYFVGANPIHMSITYTERFKKFFRKSSGSKKFTPIDTWELIKVNRQKTSSPPILTIKQIKNLRKELEKKYIKLVAKYSLGLSFNDLVKLVNEEKREVQPLDFWKGLLKVGLTEQFFFKEFKLLEEIWNYFPHKSLKGKSPYEMFEEMKKANSA